MKYFFIAGERSGDQHSAAIIKSLYAIDSDAEVAAWGGDRMKKAGATLLKNYREFSVMGFWEVLKQLITLRKYLNECQKDILDFKPDVLVLVDFPGFNLRMASFAHKKGIKTCYYISPKIWAWRPSRINNIRRYVDRMLVIFPFEKEFYHQHNLQVEYVGNPTFEQINTHSFDNELINQLRLDGKKIAVLPGSRPHEIVPAVAVLQKLADIYEEYDFLVAGVDNVDRELYSPLNEFRNVEVYFDTTYELLKAADVAIVTSGTATLEAALLRVPQVVVYKTSPISYWIARMVVRIKYISLVNLLAGRCLVKELIQSDYNAIDLAAELDTLLNDPAAKKRISEGYSEILKDISNEQVSKNAAIALYDLSCS